jgi:hypothetical protein
VDEVEDDEFAEEEPADLGDGWVLHPGHAPAGVVGH